MATADATPADPAAVPEDDPRADVRPSTRLRGSLADRLEVVVPLLAYAGITLSGASLSSIGSTLLRQDPASPLGTTLGTPNPVRSDEWLTQAPIELNVLAQGHSTHSPLAQAADIIFGTSSGQPAESLLFLDANLLRLGPWLPDAMLFAAWRALPFLVVALTLPPLLRRFGATRAMSWLGFVLVVLAPASTWWSFSPVRIVMSASLGCFLLLAAHDRWRPGAARRDVLTGAALAAVGGIVLARLGTHYVPWSATVGLPLVVATGAWLLAAVPRRSGALVLGTGALFGTLVLALTFWENADSVRAALETVHPGQRRSTGQAMPPFHLLGGPGLVEMRDGVGPVVANPSEISSAFLVCGLWAAALLSRLRHGLQPTHRAAMWALGGATAVWLAWCTISWGPVGEHLPLLNLVAAPRAAQTVGYPASLLLCLVLSGLRPTGWRGALPAAAACALATAYGVSDLQQQALPTLGSTTLLLCTLVVAAVVVAVTVWRSWPTVVAVAVVLVATGWFVNPLQLGLGDLRVSGAAGAARLLADRADADASWVAADSPSVSALLVANGVPMLSGYQPSGPDVDAWRLLDPDGSEEEVWNRGASFLYFSFAAEPGSAPTVDNPNADIVQVTVDPCEVDPALGLGRVVSGARLSFPCLERESRFRWNGTTQYVYTVASTGS